MAPAPRRRACGVRSSAAGTRGLDQWMDSSGISRSSACHQCQLLNGARRARESGRTCEIARIDHWFKNSFMVLGVILAVFYQPAGLLAIEALWRAARSRSFVDLPGRVEQLRAQRAARRPDGRAAPGEDAPAGAVRAGRVRRSRTRNGSLLGAVGVGLALTHQRATSPRRRCGSGHGRRSTTCRRSARRSGRTWTCSASRSTTRSACCSAGSRWSATRCRRCRW